MTMRVFLDASVLFAAAYSVSGSARDLLLIAAGGKAILVVSPDVIEETRRNLARKAPSKSSAFIQLIDLLAPEVVQPALDQIRAAEAYVAHKDAPIVAAAIAARADFLVTYDRRDLLDPPEVARGSGLTIVTPDVVLERLRAQND